MYYSRDCSGDLTPGPSLSQITCQIEAVGGVEPGSLPRLIQLQVWPHHHPGYYSCHGIVLGHICEVWRV